MKDKELQFDRTCHVLYSKPCKKEIRAKIALHYPEAEREAVWEKVQRQYVEFLSDWRTDLGGKQNFHNAAGAMLYVVVEELIPEMSQGKHSNLATVFFAAGFSVMMVLDVALG